MGHLPPFVQMVFAGAAITGGLLLVAALFLGMWLDWQSAGERCPLCELSPCACDAEDRAAIARLHAVRPELDEADAKRLTVRIFGSGPDAPPADQVAEAWRLGAAVAAAAAGRRICRICGCWELEACDGGCWWVADDLCSRCGPDKEQR